MQNYGRVRTATVAVYNVAYSFDKPFSYVIPSEFYETAVPGVRVVVPFGRGGRKRAGLILSVDECVPDMRLKPVISVVDHEPVINDEMMDMVYWLKENTFCTYYDAIKTILPSGMNITVNEKYELADGAMYSSLTDEELNIVCFLKNAKSRREFDEVISGSLSPEKNKVIESLLQKGVIKKVSHTNRKIADKFIKMIKLTDHFVKNKTYFKVTPKQQQVVKLLEENGSAAVKEVCYICNVTTAVVKNLLKSNIAEEFQVEDLSASEADDYDPDELGKMILSDAQNTVYSKVEESLYDSIPKCFLLHGVTGSGKTAVFVKLIEKTLLLGKQAMLLIPEISLTPQIVSRFRRLFGSTVSVIHSDLSLSQRLDEYKRISRGMSRIVIGTRSAVFAPLENIGIIIIDEEGERSYKSDSAPRYNAISVAKKRCSHHGSVLLLGSATPSLESYYYAKKGVYELLELKERFNRSALPHVEIVDMNIERSNGNLSEFSEVLVHEIEYNLKAGEQTILLLNRRGYHTFITCAECNKPLYCENCSIPYTYHKVNGSLICHYCGSTTSKPDECSSCGSRIFKQMGFGTQKMEEQLSQLFPQAKILRMDADTTFSRYSYEKNFSDFSAGKYDIMVGTQMIGKGLDFPNVTLVGILSVDKSLFSGDFRSYERTFSLITQVAGRSGRGGKKGRAYLQTFMPDHYVLGLAAAQNYEGFYEEEMSMRKTMIFPPICDICTIGISSTSDKMAAVAADTLLHIVRDLVKELKVNFPLRVLGPAQSHLAKVNNKYRYRLIIKCKNNKELRDFIRKVLLKTAEYREFSNVSIYADINGEIV
ncbi:MAG: primosomal protein N' [Oscillospiraceae bacterium]|nr:primosomal protein N' [Oscillospiraceae bacterium]